MAVREGIGDEPEGRLRRVDVRAAGDVLLQDVVLNGAGQPLRADALLVSH